MSDSEYEDFGSGDESLDEIEVAGLIYLFFDFLNFKKSLKFF